MRHTKDTTPDPTRRTVLRTAVGATASAAALTTAGTAVAQEGGAVRPDFGGWLAGVDGGFSDLRGQSEVTVRVGGSGNSGAFAFAPAGVWVDPGTTVIWEWTGEGGAHNVHAQEGAEFSSGDPVAEEGTTFEHTFEAGGITTYQCDPHASLGMRGAVAVGDVATVSAGEGGSGGFELPGGENGFAFLALMFGTAGLGALAVLAGEFYGSLDAPTENDHQSAYVTVLGAAAVGFIVLAAVVVRLVLAA